MRAPLSFAALAVAASVSACSGVAGGGDMAGPPEWFLRDHERRQLAAAEIAAAGGMRFAVVTDQPARVYRERVAGLIESCWINGEPGWRVQRAGNGRDLSLVSAPPSSGAPQQEAIRLMVKKSQGPGLEVMTFGPLATDEQRDRLRRSFERAKSFNPSAPLCPKSAADEQASAGPA